MLKRGKKAQGVFGMSFGVIFSVIVIIFIIAVSFYAITYFLGLKKCAETGLFYEDLQKEIDRAWASGTYSQPYNGEELPNGITSVCFGELTPSNYPAASSLAFQNLFDELEDEDPLEGSNIFLLPIEKACDGELYSNTLEHVKFDKFFCADINANHKPGITIKFNDRTENQVSISL